RSPVRWSSSSQSARGESVLSGWPGARYAPGHPGGSVDDLVEQSHGLIPGLVRIGDLALADPVEDRAEDVVLNVGVLRSLDLGDDALRALREDLGDRCVVEECALRVGDQLLAVRGAREGPCLLEGLGLLLRRCEPQCQLSGLLGVLGGCCDAEECPAP